MERAVLGVSGRDIDAQVAQAYGLDTGALLVLVEPDSGAAAGLEAGDIVTSIDGEAVDSMAALAEVVRRSAPGETVGVDGIRNGREFSVDVVLGGS